MSNKSKDNKSSLTLLSRDPVIPGLYSGQQGYDISYAAGTLSIERASQNDASLITTTGAQLAVVTPPPPPLVILVTEAPPLVIIHTPSAKPDILQDLITNHKVDDVVSVRVVNDQDLPDHGNYWGDSYQSPSSGDWWYWQQNGSEYQGQWVRGHGQGGHWGATFTDKHGDVWQWIDVSGNGTHGNWKNLRTGALQDVTGVG